MIAFNVERYIEQAIESVLAQDADFRYELVIGEDCSTDGTGAILDRYARQYPGTIRVIRRERNLGMNANFFSTYLACEGAYVALLDADDYWTSPKKMRMQVEFLERHPAYAICFHNAIVVYEDDEDDAHPFHLPKPNRRLSAPMPKARSGLRELVSGNFMQTASVMYRGGLVRDLPEWVMEMPTFDWPLHVLHAERGDIGYCDETMSAYRVHRGGMWSSGLSYYRTTADIDRMIRAYALLDRYLGGRYREDMRPALAFLCEKAMNVAVEGNDGSSARHYAEAFLGALPWRRRVRQGSALRLVLMDRVSRGWNVVRSAKDVARHWFGHVRK